MASCILSKRSENTCLQFDIDRLVGLPILQAVYAETLRLRMHFYVIRMPDRVDMPIQDWIIPRKKVAVVSTTVAHLDSKAWNTGPTKEYPLDMFWVGRFLVRDVTDPSRQSIHSPPLRSTNEGTNDATFSLKGLEGSWIPYGGGPRQCPGRHFAKRQILHTIALVVSLFDCKFLNDGMDVKEDHSLAGFGSGISNPAGRVPVKIRARSEDHWTSGA